MGRADRAPIRSERSFLRRCPGCDGLGLNRPNPHRRSVVSYLIALAARVVQEVSDLVRRAKDADKHLATLSIDTEIRFRSSAERAAFTADLTRAVTSLAAQYHDASSPGGRSHRLIVAAHPTPYEKTVKEQS